MQFTVGRKGSILIFIVTFIAVGAVHLSNNHFLSDSAPSMLREGITVRTADDASYLAPVENFLAGHGWRSNAVGDAAYTTRSPGYGLFYLIFRALLSQKAALVSLMVFQMLLFAFAVSLIPEMLRRLGTPFRWAFAVALFIGVMPTFSGFVSYTLTEGITPALVLIFLYFLIRSLSGSFRDLGIAIALVALLILVRPAMLIWVFAIPVVLWKNPAFRNWKKVNFVVLVAFIPLTIWNIWAFSKTNTFVGLHPIYHADSNNLYRPLHRDIWNFHKSWGQKGADFHREMTGLWQDALDSVSPKGTINHMINSMNSDAVDEIGEENLRQAYSEYYHILSRQVPFYKKGIPMAGIDSLESGLSQYFRDIRDTYVNQHWFFSNVVVPLRVYGRLTVHSNLSLYMFQRPLRGKAGMEVFRYFSFFIFCGTCFLFPIALIVSFRSRKILSVGLPVLVYLVYLCLIQRGIEERYMAPVIIPMLLVVIVADRRFYFRGIKKINL